MSEKSSKMSNNPMLTKAHELFLGNLLILRTMMAVPSSTRRVVRQHSHEPSGFSLQREVDHMPISTTDNQMSKISIEGAASKRSLRKSTNKGSLKQSHKKKRETTPGGKSTSRRGSKKTSLPVDPRSVSPLKRSASRSITPGGRRPLLQKQDSARWKLLQREASLRSLTSSDSLSPTTAGTTASVAHDLAYRELLQQQARAWRTVRERLQSDKNRPKQMMEEAQPSGTGTWDESIFCTFPSTQNSSDDCWAEPKFVGKHGKLPGEADTLNVGAEVKNRKQKKKSKKPKKIKRDKS